MKIKVDVSGFEDLEAALMQLDKKTTQRGVLRRVLRTAGEPIAAAMQQNAPRDSGRLANSIKISTKAKGDVGTAAYAKAMRASKGNASISVQSMRDARRSMKGTAAPVMMFVGTSMSVNRYAHLVEFGTAPHILGGKFAGAKHPGTAPRPFARPAWDATQDRVLAIIKDELRLQISKAVARQAKRKAKNG